MSAKQTAVVTALRRLGWKPDPHGHLKATLCFNGKTRDYRIKIQDSSVRIELKCCIGGKNEWIRFGGEYYSKILILEDHNVRIGSLLLKPIDKELA